MASELISAKIDVVFKKLFVDNRDLLEDFVASMLDIPNESIKKISVTNSELTPEDISAKFSRLDLNLVVEDKLVNVEMQVNKEPDYADRTLYYWAKLYTSELKSGEEYSELKKTIAINIIDFDMFEGKNYHTEVAAMIKGTDKVFSDKFSIHFFELRKVSEKPQTRREQWLQFINADSKEEFEMVKATGTPKIQKAVKVILDMSEDTRVREMVRMREKTLHDEASALKHAKDEGRAEGRAEAISEATEIFTANLRAMGMSEAQIQMALGLSPAQPMGNYISAEAHDDDYTPEP